MTAVAPQGSVAHSRPAPGTVLDGGHALVAALIEHGVEVVFGIPGTHNLAIYAGLSRFGVRHVTSRHEQGAGYAADGYARVSGRPGVCLTTTGPAILNAATAAAQAYSDSVPVLFISPGMPLNHPGRGNGLLHEVKDQRAAMQALVGFSHRVSSVAEIPLAVAQSFAAMGSGRPRPIHLEIPFDLLAESAIYHPVAPVQVPSLHPSAERVEEAVLALETARRPVIVVGGGAKDAATQVRSLAERLDAPVVCTAAGRGVVPHHHRQFVGAGLHHASVASLVQDSDLLLVIGCELAPADLWNGPLAPGGAVVRIDIDATAILTNLQPTVALVGDADSTLTAVIARLGHPRNATEAELASVVTDPGSDVQAAPDFSPPQRAQHWRELLDHQASLEGAPWLSLIAVMDAVLGPQGTLAADNTMVSYYGALSNLPAQLPRRFLFPAGLGTLGYALPAAIGAKCALPGQRVMALLGDGGLMFCVQELAAACAAGLTIPIVLVDNGGYGEIGNEMQDRGDPVHAVRLGGVDWVALAESLGAYGMDLELQAPSQQVQALTTALENAFQADRPTLIRIAEHSRASALLTDSEHT